MPDEYGDYGDDDDEIASNQEEDYSSKTDTFVEMPHKREYQSLPTTEIPTHQIQKSSQETSHTEVICPADCFCIQNSHFFLNCSNRDLTQIPKNIPNNVYEIDLSNNNITQVDVLSFASLPSLYKINLANNQIDYVERQAFRDLENLRIIDLTNNSLTQIQPETFNEASRVEQLWLAGNPIEMPNIGPFLDQKGLKLLDLENCNLTNSDLQPELFKPLVVLKSLNLMNNFFEGVSYFARKSHLKKYTDRNICIYCRILTQKLLNRLIIFTS